MSEHIVNIDLVAANLYWTRTPWSRKPGHRWHELAESSRVGWRQTAIRLLIKQGLLIEKDDE